MFLGYSDSLIFLLINLLSTKWKQGGIGRLPSPLTPSGPAFSVNRQARGDSEPQMPKVKVNINRLK